MSADLKFHPLAGIFPLMEGAEFDALVADIRANGLQQNIALYEGKILDGRNRYRACPAAGVAPVTYNADRLITDPAAYVISANLHRRHLTAEQKRDCQADQGAASEVEPADREDGEGEPHHRRNGAHQNGGSRRRFQIGNEKGHQGTRAARQEG